MEVLKKQIQARTQLGCAIVVYKDGELAAHVVGGICRPPGTASKWIPVNETSLFFVNSVTKGVCATAFMSLLDQPKFEDLYDQKVSSHWPEFGKQNKQDITIETALSHRAGLPHVGGNPLVAFLKLIIFMVYGGPMYTWSRMVREVENTPPSWPPGTFAAYHAVSFSWIMGGLIDSITESPNPASIYDFLHTNLCDPLSIPRNDVHCGMVNDDLVNRIAATEPTPLTKKLRRSKGAQDEPGASRNGSFSRWIQLNIIGPLEGSLVAGFIGLRSWRLQCLPGNNGCFTAAAIGKIFGALANGGEADGHRFVSENVCDSVRERIKGKHSDVKIKFDHPDGEYADSVARRSLGFFPWSSKDLHGEQYTDGLFSTEGMGGSFAYADRENKLSIVVCKNVYEPLSVLGGSISSDSCDLAKTVRNYYGIK
mmetsp:Transcript_15693/g.29316  ORF Transcript_15693/g.29316 Transcript_15693/m.29316 type:complete len:424 (-) Transcript_15693:50-1321(-)